MTTVLWTRVEHDVKDLVQKISEIKGQSMSEYIRSLILQDLDERHIFSSKLKEQLASDNNIARARTE